MEKKWFLLGLAAILLANPASSQNCPSVEPTCEGMGYTHTAEECAGKQTIKCPFDTTKLFCGSGGGECDGNKIKVGDLCYPNYGSCEAAGYSTTSDGCGSVKLYVNGEEKTCYYHCCPSGYYKIDGDCRKPYKTCAAAGYSDTDAGCGDVVIYIESNASFLKKRCFKSTCCKDSEVDVGGSCEPYYSSCSNAGAAQSPAKDLQDTSNSCPVTPQYWIGTSASVAQKKTCYDANCCEGTNKCLYNGNCVTCYSSCSAAGYSSSQPSGQSCSTTNIYQGSGNGSSATSKTCYYNCKTVDTCTGANKCKDASGNCVDCYSSCSAYNSSYKSSEPDGYSCSTTSIWIGSGNGATASRKTCYYNCSEVDTCTGEDECIDSSGDCVTCYSSCEDYDSRYTDSELNGYDCSYTYVDIGSGYGSTATTITCYKCTCTGANKCVDEDGNCVKCYKSCSAYSSGYYDEDKSQDGYSCSSKSVMIGSGNGATAASETCYKCSCGGAGKCLYDGKCVDCYYSCSSANSSYKSSQPSGKTCSTTPVMIGSGYGAGATSTDCYYDCKDNCEGANRCKDSNGNCVDCYASCSAYNSDYTDNDDKKNNGYRCSSESVWIGSGNGATATSETCYKCACYERGKCFDDAGNCVDCYYGCSSYDSNCQESNTWGYSCSVITIWGGTGYGETASKHTCYCGCTCTGSNKCLYGSMCVNCYSSCSAAGLYDREQSGMSCRRYTIYQGSGNGADATMTTCYKCWECNVDHCAYCTEDDPDKCDTCEGDYDLTGTGKCIYN